MFILSRRFIIPFFICLSLYSVYEMWTMWSFYADDFKGKGLTFSDCSRWIWTQYASGFLIGSFLLAFTMATTYWTFSYFGKNPGGRQPFEIKNLIIVVVIGAAAFLYRGFCEPASNRESRKILAAVVYSRTSEEFKKEMNSQYTIIENEKTLPYHLLISARDSIGNSPQKARSTEGFFVGYDDRMYKKFNYEIYDKGTLPFVVITFYFIAVLVGLILSRQHVIIPLLIAFFFPFQVWYFLQNIFWMLYMEEKVGVIVSVCGVTILLMLLAYGGQLLLKKYGYFGQS